MLNFLSGKKKKKSSEISFKLQSCSHTSFQGVMNLSPKPYKYTAADFSVQEYEVGTLCSLEGVFFYGE